MTIVHSVFNIICFILGYLILAFIILGVCFYVVTCIFEKFFGDKL